MSLIDGTCRLRKYWHLPVREKGSPVESASYYVDRYRDLIADSVSLQLMSDVPYGVFLSGGIDSSAVLAFATKQEGWMTALSALAEFTTQPMAV